MFATDIAKWRSPSSCQLHSLRNSASGMGKAEMRNVVQRTLHSTGRVPKFWASPGPIFYSPLGNVVFVYIKPKGR